MDHVSVTSVINKISIKRVNPNVTVVTERRFKMKPKEELRYT